nr:MAG: replication associated protein [Cressdnaviricota sp.]
MSADNSQQITDATKRRRGTSQGRYWLLTIPHNEFTPFVPLDVDYILGQLERGAETDYLHWQILVIFGKKRTLQQVKATFGQSCHAELSRSEAANKYVQKTETRVDGTQFELGQRPFNRSSSEDWNRVWDAAKEGRVLDIPADIRIRSYSTIRKIEKDYAVATAIEKQVFVYWGPTGTGKSRRAWDEAGLDAYPKDPNTKFWDSYQGQQHVVIDEFRGIISISSMLRWLDRYPVLVENKGGGCVLKARKIWITSNLDPVYWYKDIDDATNNALLRRLIINEMN